MNFFFLFFPWLMVMLCVMMAMPFLILFERKILGYMQIRKGPNKVGVMGLLQPMSDGVKLIFKELGTPMLAKVLMFWISPILSFLLMLFLWGLFPFFWSSYYLMLGVILFLCMSSLKVYTVLGSGWGSKSKYALLGSLRGAAQTISYEVSLMVILFLPCCFQYSYNFSDFYKKKFIYFFLVLPLFIMWFVSCLAETKRSPFDFAEGESELVSGFNTEYAAMEFACLFLAEYGNIFFMSFMTSMFFLPADYLLMVLSGKMLSFFFIWVRGSLPRFRYDFLMNVAWKIFLPVSVMYLFFLFCI